MINFPVKDRSAVIPIEYPTVAYADIVSNNSGKNSMDSVINKIKNDENTIKKDMVKMAKALNINCGLTWRPKI